MKLYALVTAGLMYILAVLLLFTTLTACSTTKYVTIPLTTPPTRYEPYRIQNNQEALLEYRKASMTIVRWQNWYNSQVGSNYYHYSNYTAPNYSN